MGARMTIAQMVYAVAGLTVLLTTTFECFRKDESLSGQQRLA